MILQLPIAAIPAAGIRRLIHSLGPAEGRLVIFSRTVATFVIDRLADVMFFFDVGNTTGRPSALISLTMGSQGT